MNIRCTLLRLPAVVGLVAGVFGQGATPDPGSPAPTAMVKIARSVEHRIDSADVNDRFVIQVRLPESYGNGTARYPVLYVLDTDIWFGLAADITDNLAGMKETPEVIVVGIAYGGTIDDWWQKRARDYLPACRNAAVPAKLPLAGGAANFQRFLATKLLPFIEGQYRVQADNRALVGFSHGGLFAVHTLFTRPELFQRHVIIAPSLGWDQEQIFETEENFHRGRRRLAATVFLAWGELDGGTAGQARWARFDRLLADRHYEGLRLVSHVYPDETHLSVFPGAFARGLKVIYQPTP